MIARRRHLAPLIVAALAAAAVGCTLALVLGRRGSDVRPSPREQPALRSPPIAPTPVRVDVTMAPGAAALTIPPSFLGLSTEYWTLPIWERHEQLLSGVLSLIDAPGTGHPILRIGGDSADHSFWNRGGPEPPDWVFELTPDWLARVRTLVSRTGARLILDLNLVTATPAIAADWAHVAQAQLPRGTIIGYEIGNEPDIYSRADWLATTARTHYGAGLLPRTISRGSYARAYQAYARVLHRIAPGVPLLAPALANPIADAGWVTTLLRHPHPGLGAISAHRYPFDACARRTSARFPTVARLLSRRASTGMAQRLRALVALARGAGLPLRLTEVNSITCGGQPRLSDSFASALWAPDALFELLRAGVATVNVHVRAFTVNAAFALGRTGLLARPLLYGLITFAHMLGRGGRLRPVLLGAAAPEFVKVWAVEVSGRLLHVLVIDKGPRPVSARLRLAAHGPATVERLTAPLIRSRSGTTLAGQWLGREGQWAGRHVSERGPRRAAGYRVAVPAYSAALVTVRLRSQARADAEPAPGEAGARERAARHPGP